MASGSSCNDPLDGFNEYIRGTLRTFVMAEIGDELYVEVSQNSPLNLWVSPNPARDLQPHASLHIIVGSLRATPPPKPLNAISHGPYTLNLNPEP